MGNSSRNQWYYSAMVFSSKMEGTTAMVFSFKKEGTRRKEERRETKGCARSPLINSLGTYTYCPNS